MHIRDVLGWTEAARRGSAKLACPPTRQCIDSETARRTDARAVRSLESEASRVRSPLRPRTLHSQAPSICSPSHFRPFHACSVSVCGRVSVCTFAYFSLHVCMCLCMYVVCVRLPVCLRVHINPTRVCVCESGAYTSVHTSVCSSA